MCSVSLSLRGETRARRAAVQFDEVSVRAMSEFRDVWTASRGRSAERRPAAEEEGRRSPEAYDGADACTEGSSRARTRRAANEHDPETIR